MDGVITLEMLPSLCELLHGVASRWRFLGLALDVNVEELDNIECNNSNNCEICLCKMLQHCLTGVPGHSLTWSTLCECLEKRIVNRCDVATKVKEHVDSMHHVASTEVAVSETAPRKRKRIVSDEELSNDITSIKKEFWRLSVSTKKSLEAKNIDPKEIATHLVYGFDDSRTVFETNSDLRLFNCHEKLEAAKKINDIFLAIRMFVSFLDFDILAMIIEEFGSDTDKENLASYNEDLTEFLLKWKVKSHIVFESGTENEIKMKFKLECDSMKCYRNLKESVAKIFKVSKLDIHIADVDDGCIEIGLFFPKVVVEQSLPLSPSQRADLAALDPCVLSVSLVGPGEHSVNSVIFEQTKPVSSAKSEEPEIKRQKMCTNSEVSRALLAACRSKTADIGAIRGYLEQELCDINIREDDEFKWTPLMWCLDLENKHFEIAKLLLKYQPQVDMQDKKEWSPLVLASRAGDLEIVQKIVELGAEIDKPTNKLWTPLTWAAFEGHAEVAEFLLQQGAQVDFPDENGWTPLIQASQNGHLATVNVLLEHSANFNSQTNTAWCALMAAAKNEHSEVVDALLKRGAKVDLARDDGTTALQVATYFKHNSAVINVLIKYKADVDHQNKDGLTALMLATSMGHLDIVRSLIEGGADLNIKHPATGWPAIFFAAKMGDLDIFKELLYKRADTEISNGRKVTDIADYFEHKRITSEFNKYQSSQTQQKKASIKKPVATKSISQEAELLQRILQALCYKQMYPGSIEGTRKGVPSIHDSLCDKSQIYPLQGQLCC